MHQQHACARRIHWKVLFIHFDGKLLAYLNCLYIEHITYQLVVVKANILACLGSKSTKISIQTFFEISKLIFWKYVGTIHIQKLQNWSMCLLFVFIFNTLETWIGLSPFFSPNEMEENLLKIWICILHLAVPNGNWFFLPCVFLSFSSALNRYELFRGFWYRFSRYGVCSISGI